MDENEIAGIIVDAAYHIHVDLGTGLLESVYQTVLAYELRARGLRIHTEVPAPVMYKGVTFDMGYRMDMLVNEIVLVELKSVEMLLPVHKKQLLTYLRVSNLRLGLLINFGSSLIKHGIVRIVNGLPEDKAARAENRLVKKL